MGSRAAIAEVKAERATPGAVVTAAGEVTGAGDAATLGVLGGAAGVGAVTGGMGLIGAC